MTRIDFERLIKEIIRIEGRCNILTKRFAALPDNEREALIKILMSAFDEVILFIEKIKYEMKHHELDRQAVGYYIGAVFYSLNSELLESICEGETNDRPIIH